jgi:hypothetical protein
MVSTTGGGNFSSKDMIFNIVVIINKIYFIFNILWIPILSSIFGCKKRIIFSRKRLMIIFFHKRMQFNCQVFGRRDSNRYILDVGIKFTDEV